MSAVRSAFSSSLSTRHWAFASASESGSVATAVTRNSDTSLHPQDYSAALRIPSVRDDEIEIRLAVVKVGIAEQRVLDGAGRVAQIRAGAPDDVDAVGVD